MTVLCSYPFDRFLSLTVGRTYTISSVTGSLSTISVTRMFLTLRDLGSAPEWQTQQANGRAPVSINWGDRTLEIGWDGVDQEEGENWKVRIETHVVG